MQTKSTSHAKYNIQYHIVFCTKYRKQVLIDIIEVTLKKLIAEICITGKWTVKALEVMPDHIHLFVSASPIISPVEIVTRIKSITAITLFQQFPELKKRAFWGTGLWSKGYYVGTAGSVTEVTIQNYIEKQKHI